MNGFSFFEFFSSPKNGKSLLLLCHCTRFRICSNISIICMCCVLPISFSISLNIGAFVENVVKNIVFASVNIF